jgi:hypothetical protein
MIVWDRINRFFGNPIAQFFGLVTIIEVGNYIWTRIAKVPPWQLWLVFWVGLGCAFWLTNQIAVFRQRHSKGFSQLNNEKMEATLRQWVDKRRYSHQKVEDANHLFCFSFRDEQKRPIGVSRLKATQNYLQISMAWDEKQIDMFAEPNQQLLRFSIGVEMARFGMLYQPKPMLVYIQVPIDATMNESKFFDVIDKVRQAHVIISAQINFAFMQSQLQPTKKPDKGQEEKKTGER